MCIILFAGCGSKEPVNSNSDTDSESGIKTYKIVMANHGVQSYTSKPKYHDEVMETINTKLSEDMGFKVDIEFLAFADDTYDEKINLDLAVGKTYDIMRHSNISNLADYYNKGLLEDITDMINSSAPNIKSNIPDNVWNEVTIDNKILAIPLPAFPVILGSWVRGDWLEESGMNLPTTRQELENLMENIKNKDVLPWALPLNNMELFLLGTFTATPGDFVDGDDNVRPKYFDPGYKEYLETLQNWYAKGYIDNQLFDGDEVTAIDIYGNNSAGIIGANQWQLEWGTLKGIHEARPEIKTTFMPQLDDVMKAYMSSGVSSSYIFVSTTSKNAEIAIKFLDWALYDAENYAIVTWGIKGKTYDLDGDSIIIPEGERADGINTPSDLMGNFINAYNFEANMKYQGENVPEQSKVAYSYCSSVNLDRVYVPVTNYLGVGLPDDIRMKKDEADSIAREYIADIIRGRKDISAYDEMLSEYEKAGGLEAYQLYTDAYKNN